MPNHILRLRRIIVDVDVGLADTDTSEARRKAGPHNLHSVGACIAPYIHRAARRMSPRAAAPSGAIPSRGTVCAIQHERDSGPFPGLVQPGERVLLHLLHRAGRAATLELTLREVPRRLHNLRDCGDAPARDALFRDDPGRPSHEPR